MSRIHPAASNIRSNRFLSRSLKNNREEIINVISPGPTELTVWKRSSMTFQGTDGFTVFDRKGRLAFRVDNYSRSTKSSCSHGGGLVLMDGAGNALLTLRPQIWSTQSQWNAYRGESYAQRRSISTENPTKLRLFSIRRASRRLFRSSEAEAEVFLRAGDAATWRTGFSQPDFTIEGSFERRNCTIRSSSGEIVATISRKSVKNNSVVLANDVFSLVIKPGFDAETVMGFVIVLDRICHKSFRPILCS